MNIKEARDIVEQVFDLDISTKSRKRKFVAARSVYYYLCKYYGKDLSYESFTGYIGFRHSTVINALNTMSNDLETKSWEFTESLSAAKTLHY